MNTNVRKFKEWLGSHKNVQEYVRPVVLKPKSGKLPAGLRGTYYKCGPGEFDAYGSRVAHPYDGDGYVSAFTFDTSGSVTYRARLVATQHSDAEQRQKKRLFSGAFGTPPHFRAPKNPANTSVVEWGAPGKERLLVFCESGAPYMLDPVTLETLGTLPPFKEGMPLETNVPWMNRLLRDHNIFGDAVCAHPKIVACAGGNARGDRLVFFTLAFNGSSTTVRFFELDRDFNVCSETPYKINGYLYMHDFVVTPTHYVFVQHPLKLNMQNLKHGIVNCVEMASDASTPSLIRAIPRPSNENPSDFAMEIVPGFITHHAHLCWSVASPGIIDLFSVLYDSNINFNSMAEMTEGCLYHIRWNMEAHTITQRRCSNRWIEFPTSDDIGNIIATMSSGSQVQQCLVRSNVGSVAASNVFGRWDLWDAGEEKLISEPVISGSGSGSSSGAGGYVMTVIHDSQENHSYVAVFEKYYIWRGPIAEFWLPEAVPPGLHGMWSDRVHV